MSEPDCMTLAEALAELEKTAPGVPLLALGQTIFWDEPMKAGVALSLREMGSSRKFVAGVHDTDYFAKLPSGPRKAGAFKVFPHNDTTTKGLWSAAAEFSSLFGSETVISRDILQTAGLRIAMIERERPEMLDQATEAFGWRGVVSLDESPPIAADLPLRGLFPALVEALDWAIDASESSLSGVTKDQGQKQGEHLHRLLCDIEDARNGKFSELYQSLVRPIYDFVAGEPVDIDVTATTHLLRFANETADLPRFEMLDRFVNPQTRAQACAAYDEALIGGSGQYELSRFGTGAIPLDLVIPGLGRGTIRIGHRGVVIMTKTPQFLTLKKPLSGVQELAALVEAKFGPNCAVVGKAVALIGMLAREFVFVFHEGASSYVRHSRKLHAKLNELGIGVPVHPILRLRYEVWDSLQATCAWFQLPAPLRRPFGADEMCSPSFAQRWRAVGEEQSALLTKLGRLKRPVDLIEFLNAQFGGSWSRLGEEYLDLRRTLDQLQAEIAQLRLERDALYTQRRALRAERVQAEIALGEQWRTEIFEKSASPSAHATRHKLMAARDSVLLAIRENRAEFVRLRERQNLLVRSEEVVQIHQRRQQIELEAELKRLCIIREAVISSKGLKSANHRPSAWWFPLVSPNGKWFAEVVRTAHAYFEPLS